jgi:hypothetical protein
MNRYLFCSGGIDGISGHQINPCGHVIQQHDLDHAVQLTLANDVDWRSTLEMPAATKPASKFASWVGINATCKGAPHRHDESYAQFAWPQLGSP